MEPDENMKTLVAGIAMSAPCFLALLGCSPSSKSTDNAPHRTGQPGTVVAIGKTAQWTLANYEGRAPDGGTKMLSQEISFPGGAKATLIAKCRVNVRELANGEFPNELDQDWMTLGFRQGGVLLIADLSNAPRISALIDDAELSSRSEEQIKKKYPDSIIDTNGPTLQKLSIRSGSKTINADVSYRKNLLYIPFPGPTLPGLGGKISTKPAIFLEDILAAKELEVFLPRQGDGNLSLKISAADKQFWQYASECWSQYK